MIFIERVGNLFKVRLRVNGVVIAETVEPERFDIALSRANRWTKDTDYLVVAKPVAGAS